MLMSRQQHEHAETAAVGKSMFALLRDANMAPSIGLVGRAGDWPWSSFHRDVNLGEYPPDWGGSAEFYGDEFQHVGCVATHHFLGHQARRVRRDAPFWRPSVDDNE